MMNLSELFPDEDYRFHMALRRGKPHEFFGKTPANQALLAERERWLQREPRTYSACLAEAETLTETCIALAHEWGAITKQQYVDLIALADSSEQCVALGKLWEPDFLILKAEANSPFHLLAGCVCFPSSWSLDEKLGKPLDFIHGVVPSLNAQLASPIQNFLSRLTPEVTWLRHNWGLSRSPELNQHPSRCLPRLAATVALNEVWLRVEHQALIALPRCGGVLFGIRVAMHSLDEVKNNSEASKRLACALRTMPSDVAAYKGLATARERIVELLQ